MPKRRAFLEAAALVATPLAAGSGSPDDGPTTVECDICGANKPAEMVDRTTVQPITPLKADICAVCQFIQNHALPDDVCDQCGAPVDTGFGIELEYPLGEADLPALKTGRLCGDCAAWIGSDIAYRGLKADPDAHEQWLDLIDAEKGREGSA
ncbi:hypothetical protein RBH20_09795 [Haloarcula sp. H-GB4]|uniref:hypothetical protein n=1 Tax=Haloarcula sp. H-GB4 TaxID=3069755 RepID=UPI0027ADBA57|nr:hypothetical protein [Haloarcula sp. H-GB4]MDQ2072826.1 hypothetical protein [Haloarcula sp. H-GB4]